PARPPRRTPTPTAGSAGTARSPRAASAYRRRADPVLRQNARSTALRYFQSERVPTQRYLDGWWCTAMVTTLRTQGPARPAETFDSLNPATSEVIATFPVFGEDDVAQTVERAHQAAAWWAGLPPKDRQTRLLAWKSHIMRYIGRLGELVRTE